MRTGARGLYHRQLCFCFVPTGGAWPCAGLSPQCGDCALGFRRYDGAKVVILIVMMMCDVMFLFVFYLLWRVLATGG